MRIIVTNLEGMCNAVREAITGDKAVIDIAPTTEIHYVTEAQLADTIKDLETADATRRPDSMALVSPRALVIALAVLKAVVK